jgi:hypothetical protein
MRTKTPGFDAGFRAGRCLAVQARMQTSWAFLVLAALLGFGCDGEGSTSGGSGSGASGGAGPTSGALMTVGPTGSGGAPATTCAPGTQPSHGDSCAGFAVGATCDHALTGEGASEHCECTADKTWSCDYDPGCPNCSAAVQTVGAGAAGGTGGAGGSAGGGGT